MELKVNQKTQEAEFWKKKSEDLTSQIAKLHQQNAQMATELSKGVNDELVITRNQRAKQDE